MRVEDTRYFENSDLVSAIGPVGESRSVITAGAITRRVNVYGITDSFVGAELLATAIHEGMAGDMDAALAKYDAALWRHLQPVYEASRDAALELDKSGDDIFAAILPAQMLIAEELAMVEAGGPEL